MKTIVIVLGILVITLLYVLLMYYSGNNSSKLVSITSLKTGNASIPVSNMSSSTRYALGIWVYVNSWDTNKIKTIYSMPGKVVLYLDSMMPAMNVDFYIKGNENPTTICLSENFPLQKWVYVTVSVDNSFADLYIDGKMVKSTKLNGIQSDAKESNIYLGGSPASMNDIVVARFMKWSNPLSLSEVWNEYLKGNGSSNAFYKMMSSYGININVLKDNVKTATYQLF
jgi:hypothetical protein